MLELNSLLCKSHESSKSNSRLFSAFRLAITTLPFLFFFPSVARSKMVVVVNVRPRPDVVLFMRPTKPGTDPYRFPPFYENLSDFSFFFFGIEKENFKLSKLKSGKWFGQSVNMLSEWLRNPGKGTFGELKSKKTIPEGVCPQTFLEVRNRSVFILDPRLQT